MLSNKLKKERKIVSICEESRDFHVDDTFKKVVFADDDDEQVKTTAGISYCGRVSGDEALFRTGDGRVYFSICDGWGEKDGILYGLEQGIFFDFGHPTTEDTILAECEKGLGTYSTWGGAMAYQSRKGTLDTIAKVMKKKLK